MKLRINQGLQVNKDISKTYYLFLSRPIKGKNLMKEKVSIEKRVQRLILALELVDLVDWLRENDDHKKIRVIKPRRWKRSR